MHVDVVQRRLEDVAAHIVEEDVDFIRAGLADARADVFILVVDDVIEAGLAFQPGALLGATGDADHTATLDAGNLTRYGTRCPRCA